MKYIELCSGCLCRFLCTSTKFRFSKSNHIKWNSSNKVSVDNKGKLCNRQQSTVHSNSNNNKKKQQQSRKLAKQIKIATAQATIIFADLDISERLLHVDDMVKID